MIFLTVKRQRKLEEIIRYAIVAGAWHHDNVLFERDQSDAERVRTIQGMVEQELAFYFHRRPWWKLWNRPKKCRPIPCPSWESVDLRIEE